MKGRLVASTTGLVVAALLLEATLRLGGCFSALSIRWHSWRRPPGDYRILCLGESTTRGRYPGPLEEALNERGQGRRFVVIDGGAPMINTNYVVAHLAENLERYSPDMVVAMIGNNDQGVAYLKEVAGKDTWLFRHSPAFRLLALLWHDFRARSESLAGGGPVLPPQSLSNALPLRTARQEHLRQGTLLLDFGRVRSAAALLRLASREDPGDPKAWLLLAQLELTRRESETARQCLRRAKTAGASRADLLTAQGRIDEALRDWATARSEFAEALKFRPGDLAARQGLADLLWHEGAGAGAEAQYLAMAREAPQDAARWLGLGKFYKTQGKNAEALSALQRGLRLDPFQPQAWELMAQTLRLVGRPAAAERVYRELLRRWPAFFASRAGLCAALTDQGKDVEGPVDFRDYVLREPHGLRDLLLLASRRFADLRQWDLVEAWSRQAAANEPWNPAGHLNLGMILSAPVRARYGEAEREFRLALALDPDRPAVRLLLAQLLCRERRWADAAARYREVLALRPTDPSALGGLALAAEQLHRPELAAEARRRADAAAAAQSAPMTRENYLKMKSVLDGKGVALVAVQYPMRSVESLRRLLAGAEGVTFVDNESSFREAVAREGYFALFIDNFAGDFGHCTPEGNRLLASNIAAVILARLAKR